MDDFAGSADQIAKQLVAGGMDPQQAMMMALRMAQSRQQADQSILGGVPTQPPVSDVPPATEILGGDPSKLFQRQPTTMERIKDLPKDVLGAGEALVSMGSLAALAPASMLYALRPGQKTQGDPMEFALRNMYMPRSERGPSHLAGLGEVLESLPQTGPLPELQAFTGVGRGVGRQLAEKGRQAGRAMAPAAANVAEDILRRQGLLMDVVKPKGGNWIAGDPNQTQNFLLGGVEAQLARLKSPTTAGETPAQRVPRHEELLRDPSLSEESRQTVQRLLNREKQNAAVDNWIDRNLTNYIKKEMATPEDPVRKLAEQGITHLPNDNLGGLIIEAGDLSGVKQIRKKEGFPEAGLAQTERGKEWELIADQAIESVSGRQGKGLIDTRLVTAGDIQKALKEMPELQQAEREFLDIKNSIRPEARQKFIDQGLSENEAHLFSVKMPINELAISLGKKDAFDAAEKNYLQLRRKVDAANYHMGVRNPWIEKLDPETKLYGANVADLGFDHIVDVLRQDLAEGRIRPEQLNKVSMEQAVRRTYEYDQEMAKKMQEAQIKATEGMPTFKEYPEQGFKWVELKAKEPESLPEGVKRVQQSVTQGGLEVPGVGFVPAKWNPEKGLDWEQAERDAKKALSYKPTEKALEYEGETMGHCVGGYCPDVLEGRSQIFSLRDEKGEPHVTIEVQPVKMSQSEAASQARGEGLKGFEFAERVMNLMEGKDVPPNIVQIKGKQNRKPKDEYLPFVQDFVRSGNWSKVGDPQNAGLRRYTDVFNDAEQRKIEALNLPVPNHMWLTGEEIQTLHNAINPEGKRLKYNASGQIVGDSYKQGGSVNHKAVASARRALEKAMAKGGQVKMAGGGSVIGKAAAAAAKQAKAVLSPAESQANLQKMLAESQIKSRLYHGTKAHDDYADQPGQAFEQFTSRPTWLAQEPYTASGYSGGTGSIYPVFAQVKNPLNLVFDANDDANKAFATAKRLGVDVDHIRRMEKPEKAWQVINHPAFIDAVEKAGYDGLVINEGGYKTFGVLDPRKIKSAIGNRGTYDITSPELSKAYGGEVKMGTGGSMLGTVAGKAAAAGKKSTQWAQEAAAAKRAPAKSKEEIEAIARRMAAQTQPGFVRASEEQSINPAGKSQLLYEMEQRTPMVVESTIADRPVPNVDYEQQLGKVIVGVPGDPTMGQVAVPGSLDAPTRGGKQLVQVGDVRPETPVQLYGGPRYGANLDETFWASNLSPARAVQNLVQEMAQKYGAEQVLGKYIKMSPESSRFAMHNLDALISVLQPEKLDKDKVELLNNLVRKGNPKHKFPEFAGFEDPVNVLLQAQMNSKLRKQISEVLEKPSVAKQVGFPFPGKVVQTAITEPELRNVETGVTGFAMGKMNPEGKLSFSSHPTYDYDIPGQAIGRSKYLIPSEMSFPDFTAWYRSRPDVQAKVDPINMMKSYGPRQVIDQQYIDEIKMYEEAMKRLTGKKKGGLMKKSSKLPKVIKSGKVGGLSALRK